RQHFVARHAREIRNALLLEYLTRGESELPHRIAGMREASGQGVLVGGKPRQIGLPSERRITAPSYRVFRTHEFDDAGGIVGQAGIAREIFLDANRLAVFETKLQFDMHQFDEDERGGGAIRQIVLKSWLLSAIESRLKRLQATIEFFRPAHGRSIAA